MSVKRPRILLIDIENAPILADVWKLWDENVGLSQIAQDWYILSFAARFLGEKKVHYHDQRDVANIEDDSGLLSKLWTLLDEADIVIAHNGDRFDVPKINARFIKAGFLPPSPYRQIDTLKIAKAKFKFTSNRLAYLAVFLGVPVPKDEHKQFPGHTLWTQVRKGNIRAWNVMKRYNIADIDALFGVYLKLRAWDKKHPNLAVIYEDDEPRCPVCGGVHLSLSGTTYTNTGAFQNYVCADATCAAHSRDKVNLLTKEKRRSLLAR